MQVQNIQPVTFESKRRFLTPKMHETLTVILTRMNSETEYATNGDIFESKILKKLKYKDKAMLIDGRMFLKKLPKEQQTQKETLFSVGNAHLIINNSTGEITDYYKPLFSTWKSILKKLDNYITLFNEHYDNKNVVSKRYLSMKDFTEQGYEKYKKITDKVDG